jgi:Protein of unknown function (DUF732)
MRTLLILVGFAVMTGLAAPARADTKDDQFVVALHAAGITFPDQDKVITAGRWVCTTANQGTKMVDIVKTIQDQNPGLHADNAAKFTAIAADVYCPNALAHTGQ